MPSSETKHKQPYYYENDKQRVVCQERKIIVDSQRVLIEHSPSAAHSPHLSNSSPQTLSTSCWRNRCCPVLSAASSPQPSTAWQLPQLSAQFDSKKLGLLRHSPSAAHLAQFSFLFWHGSTKSSGRRGSLLSLWSGVHDFPSEASHCCCSCWEEIEHGSASRNSSCVKIMVSRVMQGPRALPENRREESYGSRQWMLIADLCW